jgi:hypothetical protein
MKFELYFQNIAHDSDSQTPQGGEASQMGS